MQLGTLALIIAIIVLLALAAAVVAVLFLGGHRKSQVRDLLRGVLSSTAQPIKKKKLTPEDIELLKSKTQEQRKQSQFSSILFRPGSDNTRSKIESTRFFQAGLFTAEDRRVFFRLQVAAPIVSLIVCTTLMIALDASPLLITIGMIIGLFIGLTVPQSWIDRRIKQRTDAIKYFLPVVIEQVAIGVSSSLDIWPCITHILEMARQRNTHNPVTELMLYVEKLISSGLSLQDALYEVAQASGVQQIKHTFRYLGQVAEHGGEISKQLQELADAVMNERQGDVEELISSLPVKATGPLFMVFTGYFMLMMAGIFAKLITSFPES